MTIKYSIKCHGCEVLVRQTEDKQYHLVIQAKTNPLSYGNLLKTYKGKHEAIQAAEQFCKMMASAKERGYHLEKEYFVRPEGKKIPISACLRTEAEASHWMEQNNQV